MWFTKQRSAFYLLTALYDEAIKQMGISYQCPVKKGFYEVKSIEFKQALIPNFIKTNESFHWYIEINVVEIDYWC